MIIDLKNYISERLGYSVSAFSDIFKRMIKKLSPNLYVDFINEYVITIRIKAELVDLDNERIEEFEGKQIESLINFLNYHYVGIEDKNNKYVTLKYEANKPEQIDYKEDYLYHCTSALRIDSILQNGLCPKDATEFGHHEYRVYCWGENANKPLVKMYCDLIMRSKYDYDRRNNPNWRSNQNYDPIVLKIEYKQMKNDGLDIVVYSDPMTKGDNALFILDNVDPKYISIDRTWLK